MICFNLVFWFFNRGFRYFILFLEKAKQKQIQTQFPNQNRMALKLLLLDTLSKFNKIFEKKKNLHYFFPPFHYYSFEFSFAAWTKQTPCEKGNLETFSKNFLNWNQLIFIWKQNKNKEKKCFWSAILHFPTKQRTF